MNLIETFVLICFAYLSGSLPFGKIIGWRHGIDIQKQGSGNIGFANSVRVLGWRAGFLVLLGDVLKGFLPVLVAVWLSPDGILPMVAAVLAIAGHLFPVWLKFKGGKGIATGLGAILVINPLMALAGVAIYLICIVNLKKSAPSSLIATGSLPFLALVVGQENFWFYAGLALLAIWTHRDNLRQLQQQTFSSDG